MVGVAGHALTYWAGLKVVGVASLLLPAVKAVFQLSHLPLQGLHLVLRPFQLVLKSDDVITV